MPRTGGVYTAPAGTKGVSGTPILSAPYNAFVDDLVADANAARPITAGGTGATTASGARTELGVPTGTSGAVLPFLNGANTWSAAQLFTSTSANPNITVERTGNTVNSHIAYKTDGGTIYAGMGASMTWAVGSSTNLASSPWVGLVSTGAMTLTGTAPSVLYTDSGGATARTSGDSQFGSLFLEADINNASASSAITFRIDGSDQAELSNTGVFMVPAAGHSATGARNGKSLAPDILDSSRNSTGGATHIRIYNPNGQVGSVVSNGTGTAFNVSSDSQLKYNRVSLSSEIDIGAIFDALEPLAYDMLTTFGTPAGVRAYGLIAQDVHAVFPMAVIEGFGAPGDPDYQPWMMDYSKFAVILIALAKAHRAHLADLETRLAALEAAE